MIQVQKELEERHRNSLRLANTKSTTKWNRKDIR
jgi:hypothetical protein